MTHTVTESIYSGKSVIVPLADVQHIETHNPLGLIVVTKHTRWDKDGDFWANSIWIDGAEATAFRAAWCRYRSELEADTLADLTPAKSFYGAECPDYPNCSGGCGCGCTREVERTSQLSSNKLGSENV